MSVFLSYWQKESKNITTIIVMAKQCIYYNQFSFSLKVNLYHPYMASIPQQQKDEKNKFWNKFNLIC